MKNTKLPIIVHKIQSVQSTPLDHHQTVSKKLQTSKHIVREIAFRTSFFPKSRS